uniref:Protein tyrosine phosphatase n=1 Tax=Romanomermis culicivorax TaxID=13658 RepID=A0A915K206_ROMCU
MTDAKKAVELFQTLEVSSNICRIGILPENATRNRYQQILPYDHNRVILKNQNDYVNASRVTINSTTKKYIASQGPLENTVEHFWSMIWHEDVKVIVMLTELYDQNMKEKCHKYWEDGRKSITCEEGSFQMQCFIIKNDNFLTIRRVFLRKFENNRLETKKISHILFKKWSDFQTPDQEAFFCLYDEVMDGVSQKTGNNLILIHCSAGIGRTGTFLLFDLLVNEEKDLNFGRALDLVRFLRTQRQGMAVLGRPDLNASRNEGIQKGNESKIEFRDENRPAFNKSTKPLKAKNSKGWASRDNPEANKGNQRSKSSSSNSSRHFKVNF